MNHAIQIRARRELIGAIARVRDACKQLVTARIKQEREHYPGLPDAVIEQTLTHGDTCLCRVASRLIQEQQDAEERASPVQLDERNGPHARPSQRRAR